jgi:sugar/nucleoside kinase (ribokinase family)
VVVRLLGPLADDTDTPARTLVGPGGPAANVAAWVAALGGRSRLIYARGTDLAADLVATDLAGRGVELAGPTIAGQTGVVVSLSDGGTSRSMLTDRGVGPTLGPAQVRGDWLDGGSWLHLPVYSLVADPVSGAALTAAEAMRQRGGRLSVDLSSTAALAQYGLPRFARLMDRLRPDVVLGTEAEAGLAGEIACGEVVVKLGPAGVRAGGRVYPAAATKAIDATGAGDAFAAGYLLGGVSLGLAAAARAVATLGAMPREEEP